MCVSACACVYSNLCLVADTFLKYDWPLISRLLNQFFYFADSLCPPLWSCIWHDCFSVTLLSWLATLTRTHGGTLQLLKGNTALVDYVSQREVIDVLKDFSTFTASVQDILGLLRPLQPRYYSIASSPVRVSLKFLTREYCRMGFSCVVQPLCCAAL